MRLLREQSLCAIRPKITIQGNIPLCVFQLLFKLCCSTAFQVLQALSYQDAYRRM